MSTTRDTGSGTIKKFDPEKLLPGQGLNQIYWITRLVTVSKRVYIPGWNEYVAPAREKSIFGHNTWLIG